MKTRMAIMLVAVILVFGGIFGFRAYQGYMMGKQMAARGMPTATVSTIKAKLETWQPTLQAVGSLSAVRGADLSPEVAGTVSAIHFRQGEDIKKGALLLELDAASDVAKLHALQAMADLAKTTYQRDKAQLAARAVSRQLVDNDKARLREARANVEEQRSLVDKKRIRAPFAGRLGVRAVDLGQYVKAGDLLVTLQALDPIYADFYLPQQALARISVGQQVTVRVDTWPDQQFTGRIAVIDPKVDANTRNVKVRAELANPERRLLPGMYANVAIIAGEPEQHVTLPQTAVTYHPYGNIVYRVEREGTDAKGQPKLVARQLFVTTGATRGDQVAILKGVKAGDTIVSAGQIKLRNGSPVVVNNTIQPSNAPNPRPQEE